VIALLEDLLACIDNSNNDWRKPQPLKQGKTNTKKSHHVWL